MKFVIVHTYYQPFLNAFYRSRDERQLTYQRTLRGLLNRGFGIGDAYSQNLRKFGHEAHDIIVNDDVLMRLWLRDHGDRPFLKLINRLPHFLYKKAIRRVNWEGMRLKVARQMIEELTPDVLLMRNVKLFPPSWIRSIRPNIRQLLIGQIAYSFDHFEWLKEYDLVISSLPNLVQYMQRRGIRSRYLAHAFHKQMLTRVRKRKTQDDVVFVGGFTPAHLKEIQVLEKIARAVPFKVWGYGIEKILPASSALRSHYQGEAWGMKMLNIYHNAKIVLNRHGDVTPVRKRYANNHRLFEATGAGAMLLTDAKDNLHEYFVVGREIETYRNAEEAVKKIRYFLAHEEQRQAIAKAGQRRTLRDHTYELRMQEFLEMIKSLGRRDRR